MMPFDYSTFRAAFVRLKRRQRILETKDDVRRATVEAIHRPTEFLMEMRARAAAQRTVLTDLERRVLAYDRRYLRMTPRSRGDYLSAQRLLYVSVMAGCSTREVERALSRIERVAIRCALLEKELDTSVVRRRCRVRRTRSVMRSGAWRVRQRARL